MALLYYDIEKNDSLGSTDNQPVNTRLLSASVSNQQLMFLKKRVLAFRCSPGEL